MPSISIRDVSKEYGKIRALKNVNIEIDGPGCIAILGPNGAGKTTLLKILTSISRPTTGLAFINGIAVAETPEKALASVGALVEQPEFYPYLTAYEILSFVAKIKGLAKTEIQEISRVSEMTGITAYLDRKAGNMSKGMKQRLGIAVALIGDPDILILDEPTFGLDPSGMKMIREMIKELNAEKRRIIILSTHLIYEAEEVCNRIIIVNRGVIGYDTLNNRGHLMKVEVESLPQSLVIPPNLARSAIIEGSDIIIDRAEGTNNSEIISYFENKGLKIRWVVPYSDIESVYIATTKKK